MQAAKRVDADRWLADMILSFGSSSSEWIVDVVRGETRDQSLKTRFVAALAGIRRLQTAFNYKRAFIRAPLV